MRWWTRVVADVKFTAAIAIIFAVALGFIAGDWLIGVIAYLFLLTTMVIEACSMITSQIVDRYDNGMPQLWEGD